jgi:hypothetical protein
MDLGEYVERLKREVQQPETRLLSLLNGYVRSNRIVGDSMFELKIA